METGGPKLPAAAGRSPWRPENQTPLLGGQSGNMTGETDYSKYELARLEAELEQEREMKEMLEESVSDLRSTRCELQERLHSVDGEGNEWKTRYETQTELNGQLGRQISIVQERLEDLRGNPMDRLASIRSYDDMPAETLRQRLKLLTSEKADLQSQLMDCRLRIEQEGKAFHKTNDERRAYLAEIAKLSSTLDTNRRRYSIQPRAAAAAASQQSRGVQASRKSEADSRKAEERREDGERHVGGRGGRKAGAGSRLPTLTRYLKHSS